MSEMGAMIAELRKQAGLTQEELSERIGYTREYISRVETGNRRPGARFLSALAHELKLSVMDLFSAAGLVPRRDPGLEGQIADMVAEYPRLAAAFEYARRLNDHKLLADLARYADMLIREKEAENDFEQGRGAPAETEE